MNRFKLLLFLVLAVVITIFLIDRLIRRDDIPTRINATFNQLRNVHAEIDQAFFEAHLSNISVSDAKQLVRRKYGADYLFSEVDRGKVLMINPSWEKWKALPRSQEIAVVAPVMFPNIDNKSNYFIGITFSGERTNLSVLPNWLEQ